MMKLSKDRLIYIIGQLDQKVTAQLSIILLNDELKKLTSLWTELALLSYCRQETDSQASIKLFDIKWTEIEKDLNNSLELDNSVFFNCVYEQELGLAGGEPFGLLLANFELDLRKLNTISTLRRLGELGAFALAPIIINVSAETFNQVSFDNDLNFGREINTIDLGNWNKLRRLPQARFINVVVPSTQMIIPTHSGDLLKSSWPITISGSTLLTLQIIDSFARTQWFSDITGFLKNQHSLKKLPFPFSQGKMDCKVFIKGMDEQQLIASGFIPLIQTNTHETLLFSSTYCSFSEGNSNTLSLEHMLAACRFGHFIKLIARDKIGSHSDESVCELYLRQWLGKYTAQINEQNLRFRYPLRNFDLKLSKIAGKPGYFNCQILLEPHMKLENMTTRIILNSELLDPNSI